MQAAQTASHILIVADFMGLVAGSAVALQDGLHIRAGVLKELPV